MGKGQDAKKNVKKEAGKTAKEKKAAKREKKAKKGQFFQLEKSTSEIIIKGDNMNQPHFAMQVRY